MYASMSYQSILSTECLITYFTAINAVTTMYITGRSAFSAFYMKLFIQRTLVNTQRVNIMIYSDKKTNYLYRNVYIKEMCQNVLYGIKFMCKLNFGY